MPLSPRLHLPGQRPALGRKIRGMPIPSVNFQPGESGIDLIQHGVVGQRRGYAPIFLPLFPGLFSQRHSLLPVLLQGRPGRILQHIADLSMDPVCVVRGPKPRRHQRQQYPHSQP